tara:strand:- start:795 stop:1151 length:357 start_codon:yes stop_codon:yes gene_type:complete
MIRAGGEDQGGVSGTSGHPKDDGNSSKKLPVYEVEKIRGQGWRVKKNNQVRIYLVEWKGYPEKEEWTWEPEANLDNCPAILGSWLRRRGKKRQWYQPHVPDTQACESANKANKQQKRR